MDNENLADNTVPPCHAWPLFYLKAEWTVDSFSLEEGVSIHRIATEANPLARAGAHDEEDDHSEQRDQSGSANTNCTLEGALQPYAHLAYLALPTCLWAAAIRLDDEGHRIPHGTSGAYVDYRYRFEQELIRKLLMALRLVRATGALAPVRVKPVFDGTASIVGFECADDCMADYSETPSCYETVLTDDDIPLLQSTWSTLCCLFKIPLLRLLAFDEAAFQRMDSAAVHRTSGIVESYRQTLINEQGFSPTDAETLLKQAFGHDFGSGESGVEQSMRAQHLEDLFSQRWHDSQRNETRLGRAVTIFDEGQALPSTLHAFLSMFLVLETLFNTESGETAYKIALRGSKLIWAYGRKANAISALGFQTIEELNKRIHKLYSIRSKVIHGAVSFNNKELTLEAKRDSFSLARGALQTILLNPDLCNRFTAHDTEGNEPESLRQFFRNLELG